MTLQVKVFPPNEKAPEAGLPGLLTVFGSDQLQPLVEPQVSHFRQVPLRTIE